MSGKNFFGQNPLFKRAFSVAFVLFLVLGVLVFVGCPTDNDDTSDPVPAKPVISTITIPSKEKITLTWGAADRAESYSVYYAPAVPDVTPTIEGTSATIDGLTEGSVYYVWVTAKNSTGSSEPSDYQKASLTPPDAPSGIKVTAGNTALLVTWTAVPGATSYEVYKGETKITTDTDKTDTAAVIFGLTNDTSCSITVAAVNLFGEGTKSTVQSVTPTTFEDTNNVHASLKGDWQDTTFGDTYKINDYSVFYESDYGDPEGGAIRTVIKFGDDSGVIIFEFNRAKANGRTYGAVYYKELKTEGGTTSAKMGSAGKYESTEPYADITPVITTLEKAKEEFTLDNGDGNYVARWGGPYVKQQQQQ
jgi:hypothetical protein